MADTSFLPLAQNNSVSDILKQLRNPDEKILKVISTERWMHIKVFYCYLTIVCRLMLAKRKTKLFAQFDVDEEHPLVSVGKCSGV